MNILFSPLGKTDPIKYNHDGAMLHICRHYDIDKVYMYMSKEICDEEDKDSRFTYCLDRLGELVGKKIDRELIRKEELTDGIERFDYFTEEFAEILNRIHTGMKDDDTLYLNTSSGTPAMKATLQYLIPLTPYKIIPIQVSTPQKSSNEKHEERKDFVPELEWDCNEDNTSDINRCIVSELKNYGAKVQKKMIAALLEKYDYIGAWVLAKEIQPNLSVEAFELLTAAKDRYMLNHRSAKAIFDKYSVNPIDVVQTDIIDISEYLLRLHLMVEKEEYLDFLRGVTPIITELFELVLKKKCRIDINVYMSEERKKSAAFGDDKVYVWDPDKLNNNPQLKQVLDGMKWDYMYKPCYSSHMIEIIKAFSSSDELTTLCTKLRSVDQLRNIAAHQIVYISDDRIKTGTRDKYSNPQGSTASEIVSMMKDVLIHCGLNIRKDFLLSYDKMNAILVSKL